jgi:hypothetical protein
MTQEQGEIEIDLARERLKGKQSDLQNQKEREEIAEHDRQLREARGRIPYEEEALRSAVEAAKPYGINQKNLQHEITEQERVHSGQTTELNKNAASLKELQTPFSGAQLGALALGGESTLNFEIEKFKERVKHSKEIADATAEYIERLKDKADAEKQAEAAAKAHADQIARQLELDKELDRTGDARINQERAIAQIHQDARAAVNRAEITANISREGASTARSGQPQPDADSVAYGSDLSDRIRDVETRAVQVLQTGGRNDSLEKLLELSHRMAELLENPNLSDRIAAQIYGLEVRIQAIELNRNSR